MEQRYNTCIDLNTDHVTLNVEKNYCEHDILVLDNVLSYTECDQISNLIDNDGKKKLEFPNLSKIVEQRCYKYLPTILFQSDQELDGIYGHDNNNQYWNFDKINTYWTLHKRKMCDKLQLHYDGLYVKNVDYKSIYTIIIYLNNSDGDTKFKEYQVSPKMGRAVIFNMNKPHEGLENNFFTKTYIRSKLLYERALKMENPNDKKAAEIYSDTIQKYGKLSPEFDQMLEEVFKLSPLFERTFLNMY